MTNLLIDFMHWTALETRDTADTRYAHIRRKETVSYFTQYVKKYAKSLVWKYKSLVIEF